MPPINRTNAFSIMTSLPDQLDRWAGDIERDTKRPVGSPGYDTMMNPFFLMCAQTARMQAFWLRAATPRLG